MQVHIPTKIHRWLQWENGADLRPCPLKSDIHSGISFLFTWHFVYDMENVIICLFMETITFGRGWENTHGRGSYQCLVAHGRPVTLQSLATPQCSSPAWVFGGSSHQPLRVCFPSPGSGCLSHRTAMRLFHTEHWASIIWHTLLVVIHARCGGR